MRPLPAPGPGRAGGPPHRPQAARRDTGDPSGRSVGRGLADAGCGCRCGGGPCVVPATARPGRQSPGAVCLLRAVRLRLKAPRGRPGVRTSGHGAACHEGKARRLPCPPAGHGQVLGSRPVQGVTAEAGSGRRGSGTRPVSRVVLRVGCVASRVCSQPAVMVWEPRPQWVSWARGRRRGSDPPPIMTHYEEEVVTCPGPH